jgi:hypothetical protein
MPIDICLALFNKNWDIRSIRIDQMAAHPHRTVARTAATAYGQYRHAGYASTFGPPAVRAPWKAAHK